MWDSVWPLIVSSIASISEMKYSFQLQLEESNRSKDDREKAERFSEDFPLIEK